MKIDEASIDHNVVKIISVLVEANYDLLNSDVSKKCGYTLMTLAEINGVIEMAEAMKEVLKREICD